MAAERYLSLSNRSVLIERAGDQDEMLNKGEVGSRGGRL